MSDNIKILKNYLIYFLLMILVCIIGVSGVFADTITNYGTRYYWGVANDTSVLNDTGYRYNDLNKVTLYSGAAPTYADSETFNGFYNQINYSIVSGSIYSLTLRVSYSNLSTTEFGSDNVNNRLLNKDFAHCSDCNITSVSGSIRRYNASAPVANNLYDYVVTVTYTFVANSTVNQWYIGSYTGDDRTMGVYEHEYTSIVMVTDLDINENNSSTIINQNQTIIDQNQTIIDQNNQNTQDIINNNNTNTYNILNNQNLNTDKQIESQQVCENIVINGEDIKVKNSFLDVSGNVVNNSNATGWGVTDYLQLKNIVKIDTQGFSPSVCFYDINKNLINCKTNSDIPLGSLTLPNNTYYIRFSIAISQNRPSYTANYCKNGNQALNDSISGLNDSLNDSDSTGATSEASEFFNSFTTNTFGLTSIITAPLNLIQSLTSSSCTELHLPLPYLNNKYLDLPCMTTIYQTHFGSFFTMYQTITYGIIAYWICVRIFNQVKDFKNPEHDEIEVVDL